VGESYGTLGLWLDDEVTSIMDGNNMSHGVACLFVRTYKIYTILFKKKVSSDYTMRDMLNEHKSIIHVIFNIVTDESKVEFKPFMGLLVDLMTITDMFMVCDFSVSREWRRMIGLHKLILNLDCYLPYKKEHYAKSTFYHTLCAFGHTDVKYFDQICPDMKAIRPDFDRADIYYMPYLLWRLDNCCSYADFVGSLMTYLADNQIVWDRFMQWCRESYESGPTGSAWLCRHITHVKPLVTLADLPELAGSSSTVSSSSSSEAEKFEYVQCATSSDIVHSEYVKHVLHGYWARVDDFCVVAVKDGDDFIDCVYTGKGYEFPGVDKSWSMLYKKYFQDSTLIIENAVSYEDCIIMAFPRMISFNILKKFLPDVVKNFSYQRCVACKTPCLTSVSQWVSIPRCPCCTELIRPNSMSVKTYESLLSKMKVGAPLKEKLEAKFKKLNEETEAKFKAFGQSVADFFTEKIVKVSSETTEVVASIQEAQEAIAEDAVAFGVSTFWSMISVKVAEALEPSNALKASNKACELFFLDLGVSIDELFQEFAEWAEKHPVLLAMNIVLMCTTIGLIVKTIYDAVQELKKLEDGGKEITYDKFLQVILKGVTGIGAVMTGLGLLSGVADYAAVRWSKEALHHFGRPDTTLMDDLKSQISELRVAGNKISQDEPVEAAFLFEKANQLERVASGNATTVEKMAYYMDTFKDYIDSLDTTSIVIGSLVVGTGVTLLIAACVIYLNAPVGIICRKVTSELGIEDMVKSIMDEPKVVEVIPVEDTDVALIESADAMSVDQAVMSVETKPITCSTVATSTISVSTVTECIHVNGCTLKTCANTLCHTKCGGHNCIHFVGCKPQNECIHNCGLGSSKDPCNDNCMGLFCTHIGSCQYCDNNSPIARLKKRYEGLSKREFFSFECLVDEVSDIDIDKSLKGLMSTYEGRKIFCKLNEISMIIESIMDHPYVFGENKELDPYLAMWIPTTDLNVDGSAYGFMARFEVGDKATRGSRMVKAKLIMAGINPTTGERLNDHKAYIRNLMDERDAIEEYIAFGLRAGDPDVDKKWNLAQDALERIKEDLDAVYYAMNQAIKHSTHHKGGRTGKKRRRKQVGNKEFLGVILGSVALAKIDAQQKAIDDLQKAIAAKPVAEAPTATYSDAAKKQQPKKQPEKRKEQSEPSLVDKQYHNCDFCKSRHQKNACRICNTVHCFKNKSVCKPPSKEMSTQYPPLPIKADKPFLFDIINDDAPVTYGSKVRHGGTLYYMVADHMYIGSTRYRVDGTDHLFTQDMKNKTIHPFHDPDIGLIPVSCFKVHPKVDVATISSSIGDKDLLTFYTKNEGGEVCVSGVNNYTLLEHKIQYNVSTRNGSCGSLVFASRDGKHFCVGTHNGTNGSGNNPNYSVRFTLKQ
jgi:hypothetical protein